MRRVHRRGLLARLRRSLSGRRSFQCSMCDWRGWLTPMDLGKYPPVDPLEPLDVKAIDSMLGPPTDTRKAFSSDDLQ